MPKIFIYIALSLIALALIPPALIMRARTRDTQARRIHYIQDMDNQAKFRAQHANPLFADERAMRPVIDGTIARGDITADDHLRYGLRNGTWVDAPPAQVPVSMATLQRGQERFNIYCTPCHGYAGYGDGTVHQRAEQLVVSGTNGTLWVQPKNIHEAAVREQPLGQIYNTITNGLNAMSGYAAQIPVEDRWAIALYVRALQRSQSAQPGDVAPGDYPEVNLMPPQEEDS